MAEDEVIMSIDLSGGDKAGMILNLSARAKDLLCE